MWFTNYKGIQWDFGGHCRSLINNLCNDFQVYCLDSKMCADANSGCGMTCPGEEVDLCCNYLLAVSVSFRSKNVQAGQ